MFAVGELALAQPFGKLAARLFVAVGVVEQQKALDAGALDQQMTLDAWALGPRIPTGLRGGAADN